MAFNGSWAYHKDCPLGKIFKDEKEYLEAMASGWVDAPWRINDVVMPDKEIKQYPPEEKQVEPKAPGRPRKKVFGGK